MSRDDPKLVVKKLVRAEFDTTNTGGVQPAIRTGWRDSELANNGQITVGPDEESPTSPTGFTGIKADGSGPTSERRGTVQVHTWATHDTQSQNGKKAVEQFADEVERIVTEYYDVSEYSGWPISGTDASEYRYISYLGREFTPNPDREAGGEIAFHVVVEVGYEYLAEP